jgi:hypothetical protein
MIQVGMHPDEPDEPHAGGYVKPAATPGEI